MNQQPSISPPQTVHIHQSSNNPGCLTRGVWFIFIGWWLSALMITIGWALVVSVIGLPLGLWFLHRVPWAQTLRPRSQDFMEVYEDGVLTIKVSRTPQYPWVIRLLYIVLIGWWWGAIWLSIAWMLGILIVTLPISIMMIDRSPAMVSLQRN